MWVWRFRRHKGTTRSRRLSKGQAQLAFLTRKEAAGLAALDMGATPPPTRSVGGQKTPSRLAAPSLSLSTTNPLDNRLVRSQSAVDSSTVLASERLQRSDPRFSVAVNGAKAANAQRVSFASSRSGVWSLTAA